MSLVVAVPVADGQVLNMAVAAFAQRLNVLQRGIAHIHMQAAHPAGHLAMQLAGDGFVDFQARVGEFAHGVGGRLVARHRAGCSSALLRVPRPSVSSLTCAGRLSKLLFEHVVKEEGKARGTRSKTHGQTAPGLG